MQSTSWAKLWLGQPNCFGRKLSMFYGTLEALPSLNYGIKRQREWTCVASQMQIGQGVHHTGRALQEESWTLVQLQFRGTAGNRGQFHLAQQRLNTWLPVRQHVRPFGCGRFYLDCLVRGWIQLWSIAIIRVVSNSLRILYFMTGPSTLISGIIIFETMWWRGSCCCCMFRPRNRMHIFWLRHCQNASSSSTEIGLGWLIIPFLLRGSVENRNKKC